MSTNRAKEICLVQCGAYAARRSWPYRKYDRYSEVVALRKAVVVGWSLFLAACLFTNRLDDFLRHRHLFFRPGLPQSWSQVMTLQDAHFRDPYWLVVKSGHLLGFLLLELVLWWATGNKKRATGIAWAAAVGSEGLQLLFGRDGRLLDVAIDGCGVLLAGLVASQLERFAARRKRLA